MCQNHCLGGGGVWRGGGGSREGGYLGHDSYIRFRPLTVTPGAIGTNFDNGLAICIELYVRGMDAKV